MTEKQGGSDVRANTSRAVPAGSGGGGQEYRLTGHKWFCSAPMSDAFLVLAQAPGGLSCFLLPRWTPGGERNSFFIQRLKNKLGNRSNASSEIEFDDAYAQLIGEEGRGVRTIVEMVNHTRLDCAVGSAAAMRQALVQALHHTAHRAAFGKRLVEQPLMKSVLADLALEAEAATVLAMRLARAYDSTDEAEARFRRIATAVAKYWTCKRAAPMAAEALECLGGNGFVEESFMPRLYRESPLNSIWEGSGNVICLDVLRAIGNEPGAIEALLAEIELGRGADRRLDSFAARLGDEWKPLAADERQRGAWSSGWRWRSKPRYWCATRLRPWRTRSAPPGWPAIGAMRLARCRRPSIATPFLLAQSCKASALDEDFKSAPLHDGPETDPFAGLVDDSTKCRVCRHDRVRCTFGGRWRRRHAPRRRGGAVHDQRPANLFAGHQLLRGLGGLGGNAAAQP